MEYYSPLIVNHVTHQLSLSISVDKLTEHRTGDLHVAGPRSLAATKHNIV